MITGGQIKAARALLGWTVRDLAAKAEIGFSTLVRMEQADGVPGGHVKTLEVIKNAVEKAGVEFIGSPDSQAGVLWKK